MGFKDMTDILFFLNICFVPIVLDISTSLRISPETVNNEHMFHAFLKAPIVPGLFSPSPA